jgi:hypothetical protein
MAKKLMFVEVRGENSTWAFSFYGDPQYLPDWHGDGLKVEVIENTIPAWLPAWLPLRLWCGLQDIFNFRNPFGAPDEH